MFRIPIALIAAVMLTAGYASAQQDQKSGGVVRQEGEASFFEGGEGDNTLTASGEPVNALELTAASRDLPLGTRATVTNMDTGKSVEVRINDRGPSRTDRIIDISERAAVEIGMEETGTAPVTVEAEPARQDDPEIRRKLEDMAGRSGR